MYSERYSGWNWNESMRLSFEMNIQLLQYRLEAAGEVFRDLHHVVRVEFVGLEGQRPSRARPGKGVLLNCEVSSEWAQDLESTAFLYFGSKDADQLMTKTYSHDLECLAQSQGFLDVVCQDLHIGVHLLDRVCAARDHDRIESQ